VTLTFVEVAGVAVAGVNVMALACPVRERAMPDRRRGTVVELAVGGGSLTSRKQRPGVTVKDSA
jgi:hypothetical protein